MRERRDQIGLIFPLKRLDPEYILVYMDINQVKNNKELLSISIGSIPYLNQV